VRNYTNIITTIRKSSKTAEMGSKCSKRLLKGSVGENRSAENWNSWTK